MASRERKLPSAARSLYVDPIVSVRLHSALALAAVLVWATNAGAGATTPDLILSAGTGTAGAVRTLRVEAAYDYANAVQADYDIELIVFQGTTFARFPLSGTVRTGVSPALADGLQVSDLPALDAAGGPAPAGARLVGFDASSITVVLPATFQAGPATAALAATVDEGPLVSNPLVVVLP